MTLQIVKAPLSGEILGEGDGVRVVLGLRPLQPEMRRLLVLPAGHSIAELVALCAEAGDAPDLAANAVVSFDDGSPVPAEHWARVRPKPGARIIVQARLGDIFSGVAAIVAALSSAFSAVSAFFAGFGALGTSLLGLGISYGLQFLLNALFPAREPQLRKEEDVKPSYSLAASRNQATPWEPIPVVLGEHRVTPPYGALPYTESVGQDQYLRCLFLVGYGPTEVYNMKIGETPLDSFGDVEVEVRQGFSWEPPITLYSRQTVEEPLSVDLMNEDGWQTRFTATNIIEIQVDIVFPNGLYWIDPKEGNLKEYGVTLEIRYRRVDPTTDQPLSGWGDMPGIHQSTADKNTIRRTSALRVDTGKFEVQVRKSSGDKRADDPNTVQERTVWTALRGFRADAPIAFPRRLAMVALRIRATSQLNGQLDTFNCMARSYVTSFSSGVWTPNQLSRNPADLYRHVLQGPANARPVPDARIDLDALERWFVYCNQQGFAFDKVLLARSSVFDTLLDICAAGRAAPIWRDGRWSVIYDDEIAPIVQMFTPANSWGFEGSRRYAEAPHAWRVRFINRAKGYVEDERIVYDDGFSELNSTRFEGIEFPGVTDAGPIWRHGRFHIAQLRLRPEEYTLSVDWEHLRATRGDRVRVQHDVALIGVASARVGAVDAGTQTITLEEVVALPAGPCRVHIRLADMTFAERDVVSPPLSTSRSLALSGTGTLPVAGDLVAIYEREIDTAVFRVKAIEPQEDLSARLTLVDDAPAISQADKGTIPPFTSNISAPGDPFTLPPVDLRVTERVVSTGGTFSSIFRLSWRAPNVTSVERFEVEYRAENNATPRWNEVGSVAGPTSFMELPPLGDGSYGLRVRSIFRDGTWSNWATLVGVRATSLSDPPPDVAELRLQVTKDVTKLEWTQPVVGAVASYEVRLFSGPPELATWNAASPLLPKVTETSAIVPTAAGTYLLKAVSVSGLRSRNAVLAASSVSGLGQINLVETLTEDPGFAGVKDRVEVDNGALRLARRNTIGLWPSLGAVVSLDDGTGSLDERGLSLEGFYNFAAPVDLGAVYTSRVTVQIAAEGEDTLNTIAIWRSLDEVAALDTSSPEDWGVAIEYRASDGAASAGFDGSWQALIVSDITARSMQFRARLTGRRTDGYDNDYATTTPRVSALSVVIDMPDRQEHGEDVPVPAAGLRVAYARPFRASPAVATIDQDLAPGDRAIVSNKGPEGFDIRFVDSAGAGVARTFDWTATGYGEKIT